MCNNQNSKFYWFSIVFQVQSLSARRLSESKFTSAPGFVVTATAPHVVDQTSSVAALSREVLIGVFTRNSIFCVMIGFCMLTRTIFLSFRGYSFCDSLSYYYIFWILWKELTIISKYKIIPNNFISHKSLILIEISSNFPSIS